MSHHHESKNYVHYCDDPSQMKSYCIYYRSLYFHSYSNQMPFFLLIFHHCNLNCYLNGLMFVICFVICNCLRNNFQATVWTVSYFYYETMHLLKPPKEYPVTFSSANLSLHHFILSLYSAHCSWHYSKIIL